MVDNDVIAQYVSLVPGWDSRIYIDAFELLRVIIEYLVSFFNYRCYKILYYSFLVISGQSLVLNYDILTDKKRTLMRCY